MKYETESFEPFFSGAWSKETVPPPNFEEISLADAMHAIVHNPILQIANCGFRRRGEFRYARVFLHKGQGGQLLGSGTIVWSEITGPKAARFALCKHEFVQDAGANSMRGWNPGHCGKCGVDLTVDSGD